MRSLSLRNGLSLLALLWWMPACAAPLQWPISEELLHQTSKEIRSLLNTAATAEVEGRRLARPAQVSLFYQQRDFHPIWVNQSGILIEASELLEALKRVETEGLPQSDYPLAAIERYLFGVIEEPVQLARLELLLTDAFLLYSRDLRSGRVTPRRADDWLLPHTPYDGSALLSHALTHATLGEALAALPPPQQGYRHLRTFLQHYRAVAAQGGWPTLASGETLQRESVGPRVAELRERLRLSGDLYGTADDPQLFDAGLEEAVRQFQQRHGLEVDGRVGKKTLAALNLPVEVRILQIEVNMERWRWLPREMPARLIMVNMAGYELELIEDNTAVMAMRVIVGRDYRQTPVFASEVILLVLNPHWYVPRRIFREDILPTLRRDPARLGRLNMRVLNGGVEVDASTIDWSTVDGYTTPYTLRQEPGPENSLGRIKFQLREGNGIYLHDTPDRHLFDRTARAFSSGCIRLEQPLELAQYLLADPEQWSVARLQEAIDRKAPLWVNLPQPMPIYFTYWTAWVDQAGVLQFRDDVYDRDTRLLRLWGKSAT